MDMFLLEIKTDGNPPTVDLMDTLEDCADLAIQQIDDDTRKDFSEIRKALLTRRSWSGAGIRISIKNR